MRPVNPIAGPYASTASVPAATVVGVSGSAFGSMTMMLFEAKFIKKIVEPLRVCVNCARKLPARNSPAIAGVCASITTTA